MAGCCRKASPSVLGHRRVRRNDWFPAPPRDFGAAGMDVGLTLQQAYQRYRPVKYNGEWWVDLGDRPRSYQSVKTAMAYIKRCYEQRSRCLYANCLLEGEYMPGMGVGFRFCERHAANAKRILDKTNRGL